MLMEMLSFIKHIINYSTLPITIFRTSSAQTLVWQTLQFPKDF